MKSGPEQSEFNEGPTTLVPPDHEPLHLEEWLERAMDRVGERFEETLAANPTDRDTAEALLNEIETAAQAVERISENPRLANLTDLELLAAEMKIRGKQWGDSAVRRMHGTEVPADERQRTYRQK